MIHHRGQRLTRPIVERQAATVRRALPELAEQILAEPAWPALAATLNDATAAGHVDPAALLAQAARHRELGTATSLTEVLIWRLRRLPDLAVDRLPHDKTVAEFGLVPPHSRPGRHSQTPFQGAVDADPTASSASACSLGEHRSRSASAPTRPDAEKVDRITLSRSCSPAAPTPPPTGSGPLPRPPRPVRSYDPTSTPISRSWSRLRP